MRPRRLELAGFASYRDPVEVHFDDTDLFVFTGPTGSGKSSLVDAMTFALYGTVPRYEDQRLVAPIITQGKREARVRLDFL
ncbi:MAG: AAA family ATPase, partial [Acidobacteriota bacterium]